MARSHMWHLQAAHALAAWQAAAKERARESRLQQHLSERSTRAAQANVLCAWHTRWQAACRHHKLMRACSLKHRDTLLAKVGGCFTCVVPAQPQGGLIARRTTV